MQRRLPAGFVDMWDPHFEGAVAQSRQSLGNAWHEAYRASPVWRFVLAAGVCAESAWAGVMGPGFDRVGRCFPMVIAAPLPVGVDIDRQVIEAGKAWFDAAEQLHVRAQADAAISVDAFDKQVADLGGPLDVLASSPVSWPEVDWAATDHWRLPLLSTSASAAGPVGLWAKLIQTSGRWCLWWTTGAGQVPASVLVSKGLPRAEAYAGFLDAQAGAAAWQSLGAFDTPPASPHHDPISNMPLRTDSLMQAPAPATAWLPDDPALFGDLDDLLGGAPASIPSSSSIPAPAPAPAPAMHPAQAPVVAETDAITEVPAYVDPASAVLHRPECALTLVAAEVGPADRRQQGVKAVTAIGREISATDMADGLQALRMQVMGLNPRLRQASEDLIDPVLEDCAVIAARVAGGHAELLRIGSAAAWHWRQGRLQPFFARSDAAPMAGGAANNDIDALLFSRGSLAAPGLGATEQPTCGEVFCAVEAGDRLLLIASPELLKLSPEFLAHSLALPSCDEARLRIATAAGLGGDPARWPLAIIGIDA